MFHIHKWQHISSEPLGDEYYASFFCHCGKVKNSILKEDFSELERELEKE